MRVYENRLLRKILGPEREEVIEICYYIMRLYNFYSSTNINADQVKKGA
jgi:hypothetical protein